MCGVDQLHLKRTANCRLLSGRLTASLVSSGLVHLHMELIEWISNYFKTLEVVDSSLVSDIEKVNNIVQRQPGSQPASEPANPVSQSVS